MVERITNAEYAVLGLLAERPSRGYELEQLIEQRGMRNWTELAFSSIYYVLKKLEQRGLIAASDGARQASKARRTFALTAAGRTALHAMTLKALGEPHPVYPSVLLGLANWPSVDPAEGLGALQRRRDQLARILDGVRAEAVAQRPLPVFVEALFDHGITQLEAEIDWLDRTVAKLGGRNGKD